MSQSESILALKQQNYEQAKQIEQLLSRMNLIMKQQRNQTSQASQQRRLEYAYSKKKMHDDLKEELERQRSLIIDPTPLLRNKNYMMKNQIKESLKRSMESVKYLKKKEAHYVKALSEKFEAKIDYQQLEDLSAKRNKKNEVKIREYESKKKYQMYWKERENKFKEEQQMQKETITQGLEKQKDFLKILEQQEMRQLQDLQKSEQLNQNMRQQIKDAQTLSVKDYEEKYGKPKESKFKKIMDIKANS
ncbi:hypothetical protein pb186bvf_003512 [Paramecium bursaria]